MEQAKWSMQLPTSGQRIKDKNILEHIMEDP